MLIAGGCLALGALYALSTSIDLHAHHDYDRDVQSIETLDIRLSQDVLRLRYGLLGHYDGIVEVLVALDRVQARVLEPPAFLDAEARDELRAAAQDYAEAARTKAALVEQFKSTNAALKASLRYFPIVSHELLEHASPLLARGVRGLLDAVLEYEVSGDAADQEEALAALRRLDQLGPTLKENREPLLDTTLAHARNLLARRAELSELIEQIDAAPTRQSLAVLNQRYREAYAASYQRAEGFRWLIFLVGALTAAGTVHALRGLARAKGKLEQLNASLDRRVHERTEELSAAKELLQRDAERLRELNDELETSNRELDDFAYIASHDLKEPLRGIHNYASFLIEDYGDQLNEDGREKLETLRRLAQRMDSLISTLLHFSRVGRTQLACGTTSIQEVVEEVIDSLHISLEERGVEVRIPEPLPALYCDRVRVTEVFRNLITNALKYNDKPEKRIEIGFQRDSDECEPEKARLIFYVRDNGIGIREKHLDAVFRIFKRLHARDKYGGRTGAGLTIVKKIVEQHGGSIWVESRYGEGTTFYFEFGGREQHVPRNYPDHGG
jgi:signal transduction histidine kinase